MTPSFPTRRSSDLFRRRQLRCGGGFATALRLPVLEGRDGERSEEGHGTATDGALHRPTAEKGTSNRADPADFAAAKAADAAAAGEHAADPAEQRSEGRRVGTECVRTCRSRWST